MYDKSEFENFNFIKTNNLEETELISSWLESIGYSYYKDSAYPKEYDDNIEGVFFYGNGYSKEAYLWAPQRRKGWKKFDKNIILSNYSRKYKAQLLVNKLKEFFTADNFTKNNIVIAAKTKKSKIELVKLLNLLEVRTRNNEILYLDREYWINPERYIRLKMDDKIQMVTQGSLNNILNNEKETRLVYFEDILKELNLEHFKEL